MDEIAPDLSVWTISTSRAKNGVAHVVPLSPQAQTLLRAAPRINEGGNDNLPDLVFPGEPGALSGWSNRKPVWTGASG